MRRRPLLYTLLALAIPLPAFALEGGGAEAPAGPAALSVSASLGECGLAETTIVCRIDASWGSVEGAEYYTVSVTRADGSVVDYGTVGGGGTSLWVPYVGAGTYSVQVAAWGTPPDEDQLQVIAFDRDGTGSAPVAQSGEATVRGGDREAEPEDQGPASEAPVADDPEQLPEEPAASPACEEPGEPEPPAEPPPADAPDQSIPEVSAETEAALAEEAELPGSGDCP